MRKFFFCNLESPKVREPDFEAKALNKASQRIPGSKDVIAPASLNISREYSLAGIGPSRHWFPRWACNKIGQVEAFYAGLRMLDDALPDIVAYTQDGQTLGIKPGVRSVGTNIIIAYKQSEIPGRFPLALVTKLQEAGNDVEWLTEEAESTW